MGPGDYLKGKGQGNFAEKRKEEKQEECSKNALCCTDFGSQLSKTPEAQYCEKADDRSLYLEDETHDGMGFVLSREEKGNDYQGEQEEEQHKAAYELHASNKGGEALSRMRLAVLAHDALQSLKDVIAWQLPAKG